MTPGAFLSQAAALVAMLICSGCCTSHRAAPTEQVLLETDRAFARMAAQKGVAEAFHFYAAENAISLPAGAAPVHGRDAIRNLMAEGPEGSLAWTPSGGGISRSGDLGWTWGNYEFRRQAPDTTPSYGKYVTIWQRQHDGSWKYVLDGGNSNPPPP
jgi:ketosteroid isomerase-like protein